MTNQLNSGGHRVEELSGGEKVEADSAPKGECRERGAAASGTAKSSEGQPNTAEDKLDKIMKMMRQVVVKEDVNELRSDIVKETKITVAQAADLLKMRSPTSGRE